MKILILKRDKIGDLLLTTPMLHHLRQSLPDAEIHMLANDYNAWVVENDPNIDRLWIYPRVRYGSKIRPTAVLKQLIQIWQLRREHFDFAIAAGGIVSPRAIKRIAKLGAKRTIAYCDGSALCAMLTNSLALPKKTHEVDLNLNLLTPLGIAPPSQAIYPAYRLPSKWNEYALEWLGKSNLRPQGYIVLGLNARRTKRKPATEQILNWAAHFKNAWNLDTVFIWMPGAADNPLYPGDDEIVQPILQRNIPYIHPFRHEESVMPALGLVWSARISIFPDGGMMHLAAASPGGVLGLFAETNVSPHPDQWGPRGPRAGYLEADKSVIELSDEMIYSKLESLMAKTV